MAVRTLEAQRGGGMRRVSHGGECILPERIRLARYSVEEGSGQKFTGRGLERYRSRGVFRSGPRSPWVCGQSPAALVRLTLNLSLLRW